VVAALDPLRQLDLLGGREQRHLADVLEEQLEGVGRDLAVGLPLPLGLGILLVAGDDLDLLLVELLVEGVELAGVEVELVERERQLVRVEPSCRATGLEDGTRLVRLGDAVRRCRARDPRIGCAQDRPLSSREPSR
jgi:hypothetical protein